MSFADSFDRSASAAMQYLNEVRKGAIVACCDSIIEDTPVLTGDLRGSWRTRVNDPTVDAIPRTDPSGELPKDELRRNLGEASDTVYFSNALGYVEEIEFGHRSRKAPEGMVRKNLARFPGLVASMKVGSHG